MVAERTEPALGEIYKEIILDHYRNPRNHRRLEHPDVSAEGLNPLCGDEIRVELRFEDGRIAEAAAIGRGCSISQSSGSMLTEAVEGLTPDEAERLADAFRSMMRGDPVEGVDLGDLESLSGVAKLAVRVKCATLAWNVLRDALRGQATHEGER